MQKTYSSWVTAGLIAVMIAGTVGCNVIPKAKPSASAPVVDPGQLTLRCGDRVELKFYYAPELNDTQQIRPDGKITLQLVGDIQAAGLTPGDLTNQLKSAYTAHLKVPEVTVIVRDLLQRRVYVAGEVVHPGLVELPTDMSVLDVVMASGGFDMTTAELSSVLVVRHEDGKRVGYKVDLRDAIAGGSTEPFILQPQDIVFVPRSPIVNINNFMAQYISGVIPKAGFQYSNSIGSNGRIGIDTGTR